MLLCRIFFCLHNGSISNIYLTLHKHNARALRTKKDIILSNSFIYYGNRWINPSVLKLENNMARLEHSTTTSPHWTVRKPSAVIAERTLLRCTWVVLVILPLRFPINYILFLLWKNLFHRREHIYIMVKRSPTVKLQKCGASYETA